MEPNQPNPLPERICVHNTSPLNFFAALKVAFAQGFEFDPMGYVVLSPTSQLVEMTRDA